MRVLLAAGTVGLLVLLTGCAARSGLREPAPANIRPAPVQAAPATLNDLIEGALQYDGKLVTVVGEAVGDVMIRGDGGWVNISDGTGALGVWAPANLLRQIRQAGRYQVTGDTVRVTGVFYRADPAHGGDLDMRAQHLEVLARGGRQPVLLNRRRLAAAGAAWVAAGVLGRLWWRQRRPAVSR